MNCTVCGKPHSKEQPLTIAHNNEWLCPGCLAELDTYSRPTGKTGRVVSIDDAYSFPSGDLRTSVRITNATIKIGNMELPIERFEIR